MLKKMKEALKRKFQSQTEDQAPAADQTDDQAEVQAKLKRLEDEVELAIEIINDERATQKALLYALQSIVDQSKEQARLDRITINALMMRLGNRCEISGQMVALAKDQSISVQWKEAPEGGRIYELIYEQQEEEEDAE